MKNLELKHLAPYLPYELKWYHKRMDNEPSSPVIMTSVQKDLERNFDLDVQFNDGDWLSNHDASIFIENTSTWYKPILHPLSDLTDEKFNEIKKLYIEKEDSEVTIIDFHNLNGFTIYGLVSDDSYEIAMPYWVYEKLFEWHFDIFGLIDAGLAVNINTLEK